MTQNLSFYLKKLEGEKEQSELKASRRKEIINLRVETTETEHKSDKWMKPESCRLKSLRGPTLSSSSLRPQDRVTRDSDSTEGGSATTLPTWVPQHHLSWDTSP